VRKDKLISISLISVIIIIFILFIAIIVKRNIVYTDRVSELNDAVENIK